jgi:hypothetical protein
MLPVLRPPVLLPPVLWRPMPPRVVPRRVVPRRPRAGIKSTLDHGHCRSPRRIFACT